MTRRIALLSDIHANLGALEAVLRDVDTFAPDPGSVGQPRDGDPRASWALYDGDSVQFRRVAYDHEATARKIRALPLSIDTRRYFADRLAEGQ